MDRLLAALTPGTRMLTITEQPDPDRLDDDARQQRTVLDHCRRHGIWIVADEVYRAPVPVVLRRAWTRRAVVLRFRHARRTRDRGRRAFSKAWLMTGWRLGWLVSPTLLMDDLGKLVGYNTSCAPSFVPQAGILAVKDGEDFTRALVDDLRASRDHLIDALQPIEGVDGRAPDGTMYLFFQCPAAERSWASRRAAPLAPAKASCEVLRLRSRAARRGGSNGCAGSSRRRTRQSDASAG